MGRGGIIYDKLETSILGKTNLSKAVHNYRWRSNVRMAFNLLAVLVLAAVMLPAPAAAQAAGILTRQA